MSMGRQMYYTDEFGVTLAIFDEEARANGITAAPAITSPEPKRTYVQSLSPVSAIAPNGAKLAISVISKMLSSLSSPAVIWAILATSITLGESSMEESSNVDILIDQASAFPCP